MTASILVATPHPAFGELLRSSLEESGKYRVHVALSAREARASSLHGVFQLAILDFALSDEPFIPLCFDLLDQQKGLRLVVVPPENNPNHPALGGLMPHGYLSRPFYLPDLLETTARLLDERAANPAGASLNGQAPGKMPSGSASRLSYTLPAWLVDPQVLSSYLEQQLGLTQALAILVGVSDLTPGNGILHASAGKLSQSAAQEMTNIVFRYWNRSKKADLMRFVRLNSEKMDFLIYATPLSGDLVLTLVYDTSSPLSQVRPQTKSVAQALANEPPVGFQGSNGKEEQAAAARIASSPQAELPETGGDHAPQPIEGAQTNQPPAGMPSKNGVAHIYSLNQEEPAASRSAAAPVPSKPAAQEPETQPLDDPLLFEGMSGQANQQGSSEFEPEEFSGDENQVINLSSLLGTIPRPDPGSEAPDPFSSQTGFGGWQTASGFEYDFPENRPAQPADNAAPAASIPSEPGDQDTVIQDRAAIFPSKGGSEKESSTSEPATRQPAVSNTFDDAELDAADEELEEPSADGQIILSNEPAIDPLEDTRPRVLTAISSLNQLEPVSPALSLLNYTCVLVPRLPQHYLTGELADRLSHWVQQLCVAFGWRLEGISVRPEYLQWTLQVAPSISPGNLVRIIRQRTSVSIFSHFSHLGEQNPSGDFWATGYLIVSGAQPPSAQLLRDYILQTRKRQGISR